MRRVLIVCGAGASSTFLARRLSDLAKIAGLAWTVTPSPVDAVSSDSADVVALTSHIANAAVLDSFSSRGIRFLVLPETVRGGFGADDALSAIADFFRKDGELTDSTVDATELKEKH